ncbi:UNKNOWN [Stylonychia lemnae]|uniref:Uncharacterized protein n=1 Tax=Stylonychia lemnae TaxID=5949 RepID=A0A078ALI9_STYLE|nr:UNKNOWN [Stylonychia lemnae]|eukprot:CDW83225.1 UNKNOWN [Stylonychia lemnae]
MNYIESSDVEDKDNFGESLLITYMKLLKISNEESILGYDFKIKNIISLYEAIEQRVEDIEVKNIYFRYQDELSEQQNIQIGRLILEIQLPLIEEMMHIIGKLCIRQLRNLQKELLNQKIFIYLLEDKNEPLYGDEKQDSMKQKEDKDKVKNKFIDLQSTQVEIRQAKCIYDRFRQHYQKLLDDERAQKAKIDRDKQEQINAEKIVGININDFFDSGPKQVRRRGNR